jgi:uncharacterized membrane protein
VARALAIVGMVMVHIGPTGEEAPGLLGRIYSLPHGRASLLFGLLAGIGVSLMARGRGKQQRRVLWRRMGFRAVLLLPLGLGLQLLDHNVAVILQYYALFFVAVAAAASLSDRALLTGAGLGVLAGPVAYLAVWHLRPGWFGTPEAALTDAPSVTARDLLVAGTYPLITWVGPLLFGMWLGRQDLRARGAAAAVGRRWRGLRRRGVDAVLAARARARRTCRRAVVAPTRHRHRAQSDAAVVGGVHRRRGGGAGHGAARRRALAHTHPAAGRHPAGSRSPCM